MQMYNLHICFLHILNYKMKLSLYKKDGIEMKRTYKAQLEQSGNWIVADNIIYDRKKGAYYLIPDLFSKNVLNCASRAALVKYKIVPKTLGLSVCKDCYGKTLYTGDTVIVVYYKKNNPTQKLKQECKIIEDDKNQIIYMKAINSNAIFLFHGDAIHIITKIYKQESNQNCK